MTVKLYGNANTLNSNPNWTVQSRPTVVKNVSVNIPSHINRKTCVSQVRKYLKVRNGFDRGIWQPPLVARLPDGTLVLFDGDHRRALWKFAFPTSETMPAQIIDVQSRAEISALFVVINKTGRKSLTADEVFVHEVTSLDATAVATEKILKGCALSVSLGTGQPGSVVGSLTGLFSKDPVTIRVTGFKDILRQTKKPALEHASRFLQEIYPSSASLNVEIFAALCHIFHNCPKIATHLQSRKALNDMFKAYGVVYSTQTKLSRHFKKEGGSLVNFDEKCVAYGILKQLSSDIKRSKVMTSPTYSKYFGSYKKQLAKELK